VSDLTADPLLCKDEAQTLGWMVRDIEKGTTKVSVYDRRIAQSLQDKGLIELATRHDWVLWVNMGRAKGALASYRASLPAF
jgi:hypothetical protein